MAGLLVLLAVLGAAAAAAAPDWTDCAAACRCKWTSGKKTALCRDAGLGALPAALSSDMQVLDVSGNSIPALGPDAFRALGLLNLQRVYMRAARLRELHRDAFRDLLILVEVDLADNEVSALHAATFTGNARLRVLVLSGNPLGELRAHQFPALPHLRSLELRGCALRRVHRDALALLPALEALDLRGNLLPQLSEAALMTTGRLNTLQLDGNPWRCDCGLRGLRSWYLRSNLRRGVALTCSAPPALLGRAWADVPAPDFACAPAVALTRGPVRARPGGNVSLACHVRGDPEPEVTWLYNGRVIGSANASEQALVIEVEEGLLEKWTNLSVFNVSAGDAGDYSCVARNSVGLVARNVTLLLPAVATASTAPAARWPLWAGAAGGGAAAAAAALGAALAACCACARQRRRRKRHRRKGALKGSASFCDQEKKLLDVSVATTTEREASGGGGGTSRGSCELELLEQSPGVELCEPPVHITIESHRHATHAGHHGHSHALEQLPVAVYPPPPEFGGSPFGNIFISVSVSQEAGALDVARFPDLLDVARGRVSTLPRRRPGPPPPPPCYDNMGPRVTAAGSSTLSLPDAVDALPPPPPPPACTPHPGEYVSL